MAELRRLPASLHEGLAAIFRAVEAGAQWPASLMSPEGVLLPKRGSGEALDPSAHLASAHALQGMGGWAVAAVRQMG